MADFEGKQQELPKAPVAIAAVAAPSVQERPAAAAAAGESSTTKSPADFLKGVLGRSVVVKLNSGVEYRGTPGPLMAAHSMCPYRSSLPAADQSLLLPLFARAGVLACLDGYMNIAMEQTEEYVHGQLKTKYGDCFIRGNNVLYISTSKRR